jgi:haloalkane dehalogenase
MKLLRTPDSRFQSLPDYDFEPSYSEISDRDGTDIRIHAIDAGPRDAAPVLLMHGEPSWSYLYRKMVPAISEFGHRVLAPDLVGFGRSDKPSEPSDYTFERHVDWMGQWLVGRDLSDVTLFCQDWGGLIGLRLVAAFPGRFARVVVANTGLPVGNGWSEAFKRWLDFSQSTPVLPVGNIVNGGTLRDLSPAEVAAYDAPFPNETYKAGARRFPALVPITAEHPSVAENKSAWKILETYQKPFLTAFSDSDPITKGGDRVFQERVPGARAETHVTIEGAGHFLQEDKPDELSALIDQFIVTTR